MERHYLILNNSCREAEMSQLFQVADSPRPDEIEKSKSEKKLKINLQKGCNVCR